MTKVELIAAVANDANLTKKDAEAAVNSALNAITAALKDGDKGHAGRLWHLLRSASAPSARAATPRPVPRSPSRLPSCPPSRPARL